MSDKKGFVLILLMFFAITMIATSIVVYQFTYLTSKVTSVRETEDITGYYADMAALRYMEMLIRNPTLDAAINTVVNTNGATVTRSMYANYRSLYNDLGLKQPHDVTITVKNNNTLLDYKLGYTITASYN